MKPNHHPDTAHFCSLIIATIQEGAPLLQVVCRDQKDLTLIRNTVNAAMEELRMAPRLKTLNLIAWSGASIWFDLESNFYRSDIEGASIFVTPELAEAMPEIEEALTGGESQLAPL